MELTALAGNAQIKAQLAHREGDLAHTYIVAGPAGSGRHTLAAQMAAALVCSAQPQLRPCGRCSHCRKAAGGIHPDITVIAGSGGKPITVDQVRALRTDAYVRPNEAERKVYLLERADRMNASAQNAMLKLLEDGPAYAVFFLLAENGSALLPTVRSRCEPLELAPVSPAQAEEWLAKAFPGRTAEEIRRAALECQGILGRAAALLEGGQEEDGLEETARSLSAALEGEDELALFEATQALDKLSREELTAVLDRTLIQIGARLPGSQRPRRLLAAAELLRRLCRIDGIEWIRLHYAYPAGFPDEVIEAMASEPKICKYLDIPFQHISDAQLASMHRRHTKAEAMELIGRLRGAIPDLALRTTLLVGYPGETEADFAELEQFVRDVRFERLGVFAYSEEEGTYSAQELKDDVPEEVKQQRVERIMTLQNDIARENNLRRVGRTERVLIDSRQGDYYVGRTQYDSPEVDQEILIPAAERRLLRGHFYEIRIDGAADYDLYGKAVRK